MPVQALFCSIADATIDRGGTSRAMGRFLAWAFWMGECAGAA